MTKLLMAALLSLVTFSTQAEEDFNRFYMGAGVGAASLDLNKRDLDLYFTSAIEAAYPPLDRWTSNLDSTTLGWSLFGGYRLSKNFAIELGYLDMGEATYSAAGFATGPTGTDLAWDMNGVPLSLLASHSFNKYWEMFGRVGVLYSSMTVEGSLLLADTEFPAKESSSTTELLLGAGINLNLSPRWTLRAEWQGVPDLGNGKLETGTPNWDQVQGSLLFRF